MEPAPLFEDIAFAPPGGAAWWLRADDGVRLRIGLWRPEGARGTVLMFPGRTEFIEKYGDVAAHLVRCGLAMLAVDWRGQGLADRLTPDPMLGHVDRFTDYQRDVAAMLTAARTLALPQPWYLLAHSMGGAIGLRAAMEGLPVAACAFSAPMWGIRIAGPLQPLAWSLSWVGRNLGLTRNYAPGTGPDNYVLEAPFEGNLLTGDRDMYDRMIVQARTHPELGLGGPGLHWLHEALRECLRLARRPSPALPCLTLLGSEEGIVDVPRVHDRMAHWPGGRLRLVPGARHEVLMESPDVHGRMLDEICAFFHDSMARGTNRDPETAAGFGRGRSGGVDGGGDGGRGGRATVGVPAR